MTEKKKLTIFSGWKYGWGKKKGKERKVEPTVRERASSSTVGTSLPPHQPRSRRDSKSSESAKSTRKSEESPRERNGAYESYTWLRNNQFRTTQNTSGGQSSAPPRPPVMPSESTSTLVGSALERKIQDDVESIPNRSVDTTERLADLRARMEKAKVNY